MDTTTNVGSLAIAATPGIDGRTDGPAAFRADGIGFAFNGEHGRFEIFKDLDLTVSRGRTLGLFGPNGTGKSTLMRAIAGTQQVDGTIHRPASTGGKTRIGYVPQQYARTFYPWASLESNILMNLPEPFSRWRRNRERVRDVHDALGLNLDLHRSPGQCSGGMLQQAALIRALARHPDILIADEPFSALDFDVAGRVREGFSRAIRDLDICAIAVLHDLQDIIEVCDLVLAIPGRPYSTNPALAGHALARVFENPARKRRDAHADGGGPADASPFIRAVSKALGVDPL